MSDKKNYFAEVTSSSLDNFTAECWDWNVFPDFGSIVKIEVSGRILFGIVTQVSTGSRDNTRTPFPYQKTEEELLREQPQIFELLKTDFSCVNIGYKESNKIYYLIPPCPPKIHSWVAQAREKDLIEFFREEKYLHILFGLSNKIFNLDELLLAILKNLKKFNVIEINNFIDTFSLLTGNDYKRLKLFLQRAQKLI